MIFLDNASDMQENINKGKFRLLKINDGGLTDEGKAQLHIHTHAYTHTDTCAHTHV